MVSRNFEPIAAAWKVKMKNNTITDKWPTWLKLQPGQKGAKDELHLSLGSNFLGTERYVEWKRLADTVDSSKC
jgi:hypothetical protein